MSQRKTIEWVLRVAVAGEFFGHGIFALQGKSAWIGWISQITGARTDVATQLLSLIGAMDVAVTFLVLLYPMRIVLLWASIWGFWTALIRPFVGEPVWDFVERWANWGAPLALLLVLGWPRNMKEWWKASA
jgi:hypothetical protein